MSHFTSMKASLMVLSHPVSAIEYLGYTPQVGCVNIRGPHRVCCSAMSRWCWMVKKSRQKGHTPGMRHSTSAARHGWTHAEKRPIRHELIAIHTRPIEPGGTT